MAFQELMGVSNRLLTNAQALAALTAWLRLDELGVEGDPAVRAQLDRVVDALGAREHVEGLDDGERSVVLSFARSYLAQALDLVEDPARAGSWSYADPVLLQAQGSASAVVARLIGDAGLGTADARILDVGTGVGGLQSRSRRGSPSRRSSGSIRGSPRSRSHGKRSPPPAAIARIHTLMRPGATLVVGMYDATDEEPLASAVHDLFTVRAGGSVVYPEDAIARLQNAGFDDTREVKRDWDAPLRLVVGRRS